MKLHFIPKTRAVRVAWLLEELGLSYDVETYSLGDPAMRTPEFRANVHPMGRVPVLEDGDVRIFESGAIIDYLLTKHPDSGLRPTPDDPEFPNYLQWFHYCEGMIMPPINTLMVETKFLPPERRNEVNVKRATKLLGQMLVPINEQLADRDYLTGAFSGADVMTGSAVQSAVAFGIDTDHLPQIKPYAARLAERPAFQKASAI